MYDHMKFLMLFSFISFAGNNALRGLFLDYFVVFLFLYRINHEGTRFCNSPILDMGRK